MRRLLFLALAGLCAPVAAAEPRLLFEAGEIEREPAAHRTIVRSGLVQLEFAPGVIVSAADGADYILTDEELTVLRGEVRILAEPSTLYVLESGRYRLQAATEALVAAHPGLLDRDPAANAFAQRQPLQLAESVMLRQDEALRISARDLARGILSVFRRGGR